MQSKKLNHYLTITFSVLSMLFLIYITSALGKKLKLDLTQEKLYTLSGGTKDLLKKVRTPIELKLYYSKTAANKGEENLRHFNNYYAYVKELLEEYVGHAKGVLQLTVVDPRPDTKDEEDALAYGLKKFQVSESESYFFGLVARSHTGTEKVIEFFDPSTQGNLEYELTKLIHLATSPQKRKIGILSSLGVMSNDAQNQAVAQLMRLQGKIPRTAWMVTAALKEVFDVSKIEENNEITGIDILIVIHPKEFSERTQFYIDQFVLKGGNLVVLVDPHSIVDGSLQAESMQQFGPGFQDKKTGSNLAKLLFNWGVEVKENEYAGDKALAGMAKLDQFSPPMKMIGLLKCDSQCTKNHKDVVSASLNNLLFVYPGAIKLVPKEGIQSSVLVSTTEKGNTYSIPNNMLEKIHPGSILQNFKEGSSALPVAIKLWGKFSSAFPQGLEYEEEIPGKPKSKKKLSGILKSEKDSSMVIMSDVDFIHDQFAFTQSFTGALQPNDNAKLFLNTVEMLAGPSDLIGVRSKGQLLRPFLVIDKVEEEAQKDTASKVQEIGLSIQRYQEELNQIGRNPNLPGVAVLQSETLQKRKELNKKMASLKQELREVKRNGREKIERIGQRLQNLNTLLVPLLVAGFGIWYNLRRKKKYGVLK